MARTPDEIRAGRAASARKKRREDPERYREDKGAREVLLGDEARLRAALRELREAAWDVYHRTTGARQDPEIKALRAAGEKADAALADRGERDA